MRISLPSRSAGRLVLGMLLLIGLIAAGTTPLAAADAPRLTGQITDQTGVLAGHEAEIRAATDRLQRDHDVQLWTLFVPTTGSTSVTAFADQVAAANSLGVNDALLVVALNDRTDSLWVSNGLPQVTTSEIDGIISRQVEPRLANGDFAGAVTAAADALGAAAGGTVVAPTPVPTARPAQEPSSDTGGSILVGLVAAILIAVGLYVVALVFLRRRSDSRTAEERDKQTGDLARRANHDLIASDEAVRGAQQELGFVEAEFDESDTTPFRAAIDQAAGEVKAAFAIRQQLDDEVPEDPPTRQRMLQEILTHTAAADAALKAQTDRLQQLRDVQRRAPEVVEQLAGQIDGLASRLTAASTTLTRLASYAAASWASVSGNVAETDKRLQFARDAIARGRAAVTGNDQRAAGIAIRDAQGAIGEATSLLDAIDRIATTLDDAAKRLPDELTAAAADVDTARQAVASAEAGAGAGTGSASGSTSTSVDQARKLSDAEQLLAAARDAAAATPPDVLTAFNNATKANAAADALVAAIREEAARIARRQAVLDGAVRAAAMAVARANDFVETRRGGVGREARTRLVEAQRQLDEATATTASNPDAALQSAQRAQSLANDAYLIASQDFDQFDQQGPPRTYGGGGGGDSGAGAIIGGILGGILSGGLGGGSWGGGGWGGTPWGSPPRSGGGGGGGRGGFGGFGGGGGRSIGGSWGGLGGRSRGGRW